MHIECQLVRCMSTDSRLIGRDQKVKVEMTGTYNNGVFRVHSRRLLVSSNELIRSGPEVQ